MVTHADHAAAVLSNFDLEVEKARKRLKTKTEDDCMAFELRSDAFISMLPEGVRNMTVKEFITKYDGRLDLFQKITMESALSGHRPEVSKAGASNAQNRDIPLKNSDLSIPPKGLNFHSRLPETPSCNPQRPMAPSANLSMLAPRRFTFLDDAFVEGDYAPLSTSGTTGITIPLDEGSTIIEVPLNSNPSANNFKSLGKDRKEELAKKLKEAKDHLDKMILQLDADDY
ncbi:hypothetical protein HDU67_010053 [Dinochytrium kinnereticum]|nr:hypothetical protein HDU67_010053 [Dinochytrium kinnereticum]